MMNNNKKTFVNIIATLAIILAFSFSTNANATSVSAVSTTNVTLATTHFMVVGGGSRCSHGIRNCKLRHNDSKCRRCKSAHSGKCGGGSTPTPPDSVPLDGGLGFLMLGAAALGVKKLRSKKDAKA
ncbi:PID-CTERM protein-sorting domain-containing protein [Algibacter sp. Ld11]|uniref:PID-CTERM protein-sorting domain-containing protein n=1 Tax=Algibacter sp. Ld11 TaxID=649150 RepID=UPI00386F83B2